MIIEYIVIAGYLVMLLAIGGVLSRFNSDVSDYFRSGCKATWWLVGASAFMQAFSAWTFTGASGAAFEAGWSVMVIFASNALGFFLTFLFLGPWFRQLRAITTPEVIRLRFGAVTQQFYAWLQAPLGLAYAALWLSGLAIFISAVFPFETMADKVGLSEIQFVILVTGSIAVFYSLVGGSWAVMATDFLQSLILLPLTLLVAFLCLRELGGVSAMFDQIDGAGLAEEFKLIKGDDDFPLAKYGMAWVFATVIYKTIGYMTLTSAQKYFGVKDGNEARKAAMLACVLMILGMFVWFIPPVAARLLVPEQVLAMDIPKPAEASYAVMAMSLLPNGLVGLMVVAMLSATMSSMDSGLNRNAAVFTRDILPAGCRVIGLPPLKGKTEFLIGQLVTVAFGVAILGLSLYFAGVQGKGVFEHMLNVGALLALPMAMPMLMALFIKKAPRWSALFSIGVTAITSLMGFLSGMDIAALDGTFIGSEWSYQMKVGVNVTVAVLAFCGTMPFWKNATPEYRDQVDAFFTRMHTPIDFEKEVGVETDRSQLAVVGVFASLIGAGICGLVLIPNEPDGRIAIVFVGGFVLVVGLLLLLAGKKGGGTKKPPAAEADPTDQLPKEETK